MPKKDGINKTYSFDKDTIRKLHVICEKEHRTETNCIEVLIDKEYNDIRDVENR